MRTMEPYLAYTMLGEGGKKLYLHHMLQSLHPAEMMIPNAGEAHSHVKHRGICLQVLGFLLELINFHAVSQQVWIEHLLCIEHEDLKETKHWVGFESETARDILIPIPAAAGENSKQNWFLSSQSFMEYSYILGEQRERGKSWRGRLFTAYV